MLIEAAIALPILILIVFGGIELALYFMKQHIVARAVNSVIIPLQLNPSDHQREIEKQIRNSGMGLIDFSLGNNKGNFVCARAYSDFDIAKKNLCSATNTFENGWHPEAGFWVSDPLKPYYIVLVAHARYRSLIGLKGILPDINEWHIFQVSPFVAPLPFVQPTSPPVAPSPANNNIQPSTGGENNQSGNNNADIDRAARQLQNFLSSLPSLTQR